MEKKQEAIFEELREKKQPATKMTRREAVQHFAMVMTAGTGLAAMPRAAFAHPVYKHMMNDSTMNRADAEASALTWKPVFFDAHQNETFTILAERVVPGSTEAQVNRFVDLLLSVDTQQNQKQFLNSLSSFDAYSITTYRQPFKSLSEEQQNQVLTVASTMKAGEEVRRHGRRHLLGPASQGPGEEAALTLRDHFENLKHWVSGAYFSSEPGMKYLGWTGQVMWPSFPGCQHPSSHS